MTAEPILSLEALTSSDADTSLLDLRLPEIGGGKFEASALRQIDEAPHAVGLRISGLEQPTLEALVEQYGHRFQAIQLWKCPRISDLSPLSDLAHLTHLSIFWNQRATTLWDLSGNPELVALELADMPKVSDLGPLELAPKLRELWIGDKVWPRMIIESLEPVGTLTELRRLSVFPKRISDARVQPLALLQRLEQLDSPTNLWTTEQSAWLRAHLPESATGRVLSASVDFEPQDSDSADTLIIGKHKPTLHSKRDAARIASYETAFSKLVEQFRLNPGAEP